MRQYEAETFYDQSGRVVFSVNMGIAGVSRPRKAKPAELKECTTTASKPRGRAEGGIPLGWEGIQHLQQGSVFKTYMDDTQLSGPFERTVEYQTPFFEPGREEDYRVAWELFSSTYPGRRSALPGQPIEV